MFEIKNSLIHGLGVFATRNIPAGTPICQYNGDELSYEDAWTRTQLDPSAGVSMFDLQNGFMVDGASPSNNGSYRINHSCSPNATCILVRDATSTTGILICALRNISKGDEITYDYSLQVTSGTEFTTHKCYCGSSTCYGTMSGNQLIRDKSRKLFISNLTQRSK
jgi:SET domain-containing protein